MRNSIPVGVSNHHIHISQKDLNTLFGEGHELTNIKNLTQPGEFAAQETLTLVGPKGEISKVRILGPVREVTQVEVSKTDCFTLGIDAPVRMSGDLNGTPGITLVGPKGKVELDKGVIVAMRHIHMHPRDAQRFGVKDKEIVQVKTSGDRSITLHQVLVRVSESYALDFHMDTDEANAAGVKTGDMVEMVKVRRRELMLA